MTVREPIFSSNEILPPRSSDGGTPDTTVTKPDRNLQDGGTVDTKRTKTERDLNDGGTVDTSDGKIDRGLGQQ